MLSSRPVDFNNGGVFFPTKTPARSIKTRLENQSVGGPTMSAKGGKTAGGMPKTPFHAGSNQKTILYTISRPLGDKTPAPNRLNPILFQTPAGGKTGGQKSKLSKLVLETNNGNAEENDEQEGNTPPSSQRPSSQRKNIKQPKQLNLNGMMGKLEAFQTPMNKGNHWDTEDEEMIGLQGQGLMQEAILEDAVEEEDSSDGEIEFGHPNNLDLPYQPPFDFELPNFQTLGKTVRSLAFAPLISDSRIPVFTDPHITSDDLVWTGIGVELSPLQSDDPFEEARHEGKLTLTKPVVAKGRVPLSKVTSLKATTSLTSTKQRPTSSLARLPSQRAAKPQGALPTRTTSSSRPLQSGSATTVPSKVVSAKSGATSTGTTTTRKVVSKPVIPSSTLTSRPIARSTSTTHNISTQPVVRQNLASLRRAQTALSIRDARSGGVAKPASTLKMGPGATKVATSGSTKPVEGGERGGLGGLKLKFEGKDLEDEFLFTVT